MQDIVDNSINNEQVIIDASLFPRSNVATAHVAINIVINIIVNHSIHNRPDLGDIKDPTIIIKITLVTFLLPKRRNICWGKD